MYFLRKNISFSRDFLYIKLSKNIFIDIYNKKARHPVGLFRIWLLDMTPVVSHDPDA